MKAKTVLRTTISSVAIGFVLVVPFVLLEFVNTDGFAAQGFPGALFAVLWFLNAGFLYLLMAVARQMRKGSFSIAVAARALLMIAIAAVWLNLVNDQMPCFTGVPNCD